MKLGVKTTPSLSAVLQQEVRAGERAVSAAFRQASVQLKNNWRGQITRAGLGRKLASSIRSAAYPDREPSMNAAALVWSRAPKIVGAHERGAMIRSRGNFFLAIPTDAAGKGRFGRKLSPAEWERRSGLKLRFVYRANRPSLLVAEARLSARGRALMSRSKTGRNVATVPIFVLLPQVKLRKRLDLARDAEQVARSIPRLITQNWKDTGQ